MAENSAQDKTEQPTPRKREEALEKGNVAKSIELNSVAVLMAAMGTFALFSGYFGRTLRQFLTHIYLESSFMELTAQSFPGLMAFIMKTVISLLGPILIAVFVAALAMNYAQVGFIFANKAMIPDFKKINPLNGFKRMFSVRSLVEMAKGLLKITIVGIIGYMVISKYHTHYLMLSNRTVGEIIGFTGGVVLELSFKIGIALLIMAIADYAYQKYDYEKNLKMTKQEVKDEMKQQEGDPMLKGRIRSAQRQIASRRMMSKIPEATVVVTNPTHFAVALKYDPKSSSDAPRVIAKGQRKIALRIIEIARKHDIPVIENKPLARGLYKACELDQEIPMIFYQAVAEILSQVYQKDRNRLPDIGVN